MSLCGRKPSLVDTNIIHLVMNVWYVLSCDPMAASVSVLFSHKLPWLSLGLVILFLHFNVIRVWFEGWACSHKQFVHPNVKHLWRDNLIETTTLTNHNSNQEWRVVTHLTNAVFYLSGRGWCLGSLPGGPGKVLTNPWWDQDLCWAARQNSPRSLHRHPQWWRWLG